MNTSFNYEEKLKKMKPKSLTNEERRILWTKIQAGLKKQLRRQFFWPLSFLPRRTAAALAVIVVLIGGSLATAAAADSAKPGDPLFGVDLAIEKIKLAIAFKSESKDRLRVEFAEERLVEAETAVALAAEVELETETEISATSTDEHEGDEETATTSATTTDQGHREKQIERTNQVLGVALEQLEATRVRLEASGNETAVLALDIIIERLKLLTEEHLARIDKLAAKIGENGNGVKAEIKAKNDELKIKFKLELGAGTATKGNIEERIEERKGKIEARVDELKVRIEERQDRFNKQLDKFLERLDDQIGLGRDKVTVCHRAGDNQEITIRIARPALEAHLAHGDSLGACAGEDEDEDEDEDDEEEDNRAPQISDIEAAHIASTTATIRWETDEPADSTVWYGTTSPLIVTDATARVTLSTLVKDHSVLLSGLTASTTHYFIIGSTDEAGNTATSSERSFITLIP